MTIYTSPVTDGKVSLLGTKTVESRNNLKDVAKKAMNYISK